MAFLFSDLQTEVKRRSTKNQGGTQFDTAIKNIINLSLFRIARDAYWRTLRREETLSITASTEEFNLPIQVTQRCFLWHEEWGYPYVMNYIPDQKFLAMGTDRTVTGIPTHYRMWNVDMVQEQPSSASVITVQSTSTSDTNIDITVFGTVGGYPDFEVITTNASDGTTSTAGSKSFTYVERVTKSASSVGRITATSNAAAVTVATIPVGDTTSGIIYRKVKMYPLASSAFTMNVFYYKDPYRLVNDGDVHELGQDFDEAIILLSVAKMKYEQNQEEGDKFFGLYKNEIKSLRRTNIEKIDWFPTLERAGNARRLDPLVHPYVSFKQFGANFGPRSN
jgi:hypothetical protein